MVNATIKTIDIMEIRISECRVMIVQFSSNTFDWIIKDGLYSIINNDKIKQKIIYILNLAKQNSVDLIIFPELSIPEKYIEKIQTWSKEHKAIVICGSHYQIKNGSYISRSPIIVNGSVYFTEKINPAPIEKSPINGEGLTAGTTIIRINNTQFGNIGVLICSDYLDDKLKEQLNLSEIDILCIPSFQKNSELYHQRMSIDCENSKEGIYILYSNFYDEKNGDGKSAIFGIMDRIFCEKLIAKGLTDSKPDKKIYQFSENIDFAIFDINLENKRPYINRNILSDPNIRFITQTSSTNKANSNFLTKISHDDERYNRIDDLFVPPKEYQEIVESLNKNNLVFIIGDAGIGKTYTAVKLLKTYFEQGYEPIWLVGLEKEEREIQRRFLNEFKPQDKQIIYIEDPFGRTVFERRDTLFQVFTPLIERISEFDCKIIITSRKEVFEKFTQESLLENELVSLKKELNVRNPSYDENKLKQIFNSLAPIFCDWYLKEDYIQIVNKSIDSKKITTPLAIRDLCSSNISSVADLKSKIERRKNDIVRGFAHEIKSVPISTKVLLYLVLFAGNKGHSALSALYEKVLTELNKEGLFAPFKSFNIEARTQIGYRLEQFGFVKTAYKFSHPVYEEALAFLIKTETDSETIIKKIIVLIAKEDIVIAFKTINKIVIKYPEVSLLLFKQLIQYNKYDLDKELRIILSQKLISTYYTTKNIEFFQLAKSFYSIENLTEDLNKLDYDARLLGRMLNLVERYRFNSPDGFNSEYFENLNWPELFKKKICRIYATNSLVYILTILKSLDPVKYDENAKVLPTTLIKQTYYLLDKSARKGFYNLLPPLPIKKELKIYKRRIENLEKHKKQKSINQFKELLFSTRTYRGEVFIDIGAESALKRPWVNLLPAGIVKVSGNFEEGDIICIKNSKNQIIAFGMTEYSSEELDLIKQKSSSDFFELLGVYNTSCAIKANYLKRIHKNSKEAEDWRYINS